MAETDKSNSVNRNSCATKATKKLSIIIPLYNVEMHIANAAKSIKEQSFKGLEIVLVDDGSTDNSLDAFVSSLHGLDVTPIKQENTGPGGARNAGILAATGEYIIFVDADDFLLPEALQNILQVLGSDKPDVLFGRYLRYMPSTGLITAEPHNYAPPIEPKLRTEYIIGVFPEPSWNSVWRYVCKRDFILRHELFFAPSMYCEDLKWVLELLDAVEKDTAKLLFLEMPFYAYNYKRPGSIMNSTSPKLVVDLVTIIKDALPRYKDRPLICKELVWQTFYYINEYCTFEKQHRPMIFDTYRGVLPMYHLAQSPFYSMVSAFRNRLVFHCLSVALRAVQVIRWCWKYGRKPN